MSDQDAMVLKKMQAERDAWRALAHEMLAYLREVAAVHRGGYLATVDALGDRADRIDGIRRGVR